MTSRGMNGPYDEWWAEGIGAVLDGRGVLWYGYPVDEHDRLGPFRSRLQAQRALDRCGNERRQSADGGRGNDRHDA